MLITSRQFRRNALFLETAKRARPGEYFEKMIDAGISASERHITQEAIRQPTGHNILLLLNRDATHKGEPSTLRKCGCI
jgi:hypothetical protein